MKRLKGKQVLAAVFAAVLGASLMGCSLRAGSSSDSNVIESGTTLSTIGAQEITPTPTPDPNEGLLVIGTKASGKHVYKVRFDNETGKTITAFQIRDESEDDFEPDLLQGNEFPSGSKVLCYYDAGDAFKALKASSSADSASESTESAANGQNVVNAAEDIPDFYIQLTFSDGQVAVLHDVPFSEFEEAMICTDAGTYYYLTYETADGTSVTTMKAEKKLKEQADEEAAAAKKKAEEEAAESEAAAKKASEKAAAESAAAAAQKKQEEEAAAAQKQAEEEAAAQSAAAAAAAAQQQAEEEAAAQSAAQAAQDAQNNAQNNTQNNTQDNTQNNTQNNTQQNQTDNGGTVGAADGSDGASS